MVGTDRLHIEYIFKVHPGGSLPPWMVNMFADKGPYESLKSWLRSEAIVAIIYSRTF
jgi:hypothetical protein